MSKRRWTHEQHASAHAYFRNLEEEKSKRIKDLEAENKAILRRAEAAEENWQLAEERIKALESRPASVSCPNCKIIIKTV